LRDNDDAAAFVYRGVEDPDDQQESWMMSGDVLRHGHGG
jgi:hypothetical protein